MKKSEIQLTGLQVKSHYKLRRFCQLIDELEKEFGIREVRITLDDVFVCPDIDLKYFGSTPMEELIVGLIRRTR